MLKNFGKSISFQSYCCNSNWTFLGLPAITLEKGTKYMFVLKKMKTLNGSLIIKWDGSSTNQIY
jgi:hypothetical protein